MAFNCQGFGSSYGKRARASDDADYSDKSYDRDIDYRRDRQRREAHDYDEWEMRREDSCTWPSGYDNLRHKDQSGRGSWNERQECSRGSPRDEYDERKMHQESDDGCKIFVGGLPTFIAESDIEDNLNSYHLQARDIRVVKKKDPGSNRGFAFVEFYSASEAQEWMDQTKGVLNFCEGISTTLSVSRSGGGREERLPKPPESPPRRINDTPPTVYKGDWKCVKVGHFFVEVTSDAEMIFNVGSLQCGCINFRRRGKCFKCKVEREESDYEITLHDGSDFVGIAPTETLLLRGLSPITDEARVRQVLFYATKVSAKDVFVARNPVDHASAGFGFVLVESPADSISVLDALRGSGHPLEIDGCSVQINFSKMNFLNAMVMLSHRGFLAKSLSSLEEMANQKQEGKSSDRNHHSHVDSHESSNNGNSESLASPDTSRYVFDDTSGYYYDSVTELYYDAGSQYYYDNKKGCFLYWDDRRRRYVEAPQVSESPSLRNEVETRAHGNTSVSVSDEKAAKAKQAKKIALEMEKWARQQNAQKETSFKKPLPVIAAFKKPSAADVGFKVLTKSEKTKIDIKLGREEKTNILSKLVASYGDSDSDEESSTSAAKELESLEEKFTDWKKLTCLLCKRVFTSVDVLKKHKVLSDLHKANLEKYKEKLTGTVTAV